MAEARGSNNAISFSLLDEYELLNCGDVSFSANDTSLVVRSQSSIFVFEARQKLHLISEFVVPESRGTFACHPCDPSLLVTRDEHVIVETKRTIQRSFVRIWRLPQGLLENTIELPGFGIGDIKFAPDGKWLATFSHETFFFISLESNKIEYEYPGGEYSFNIDFSLDSKTVLTATNSQAGCEVRSFQFPEQVFPYGSLPDANDYANESWWEEWHEEQYNTALRIRSDYIKGPVISPNARWFAISHRQPILCTFPGKQIVMLTDENDRTFQTVGEYHIQPEFLWSNPVFSINSQYLLCGAPDGYLFVWDVETKKVKAKLEAHSGQITALTFSKTGEMLVTAGIDHKLRLWSIGL